MSPKQDVQPAGCADLLLAENLILIRFIAGVEMMLSAPASERGSAEINFIIR